MPSPYNTAQRMAFKKSGLGNGIKTSQIEDSIQKEAYGLSSNALNVLMPDERGHDSR